MNAITFKEKYIPYHRSMYRVAYRLLEDVCDAEDVVQEAYIKLWNKRGELVDIENIESYCVVLARNLSLDFLRSKKRCHIQPDENNMASEYVLYEDNLDADDNIKYIESVIKRLPTQQQRVMILRHLEECSLEEIEQRLGLNSVNVRVLLSRARKKMKELFNVDNYYGSR